MVAWEFWLFRAKSGSFLSANVWRKVIVVDARFRDINRLVLFCLVGKWIRVFNEGRSKAKNLLKIKKAVSARDDQRLKIKLPWTDKEIDKRQHWILVSNLMSWTKATDIRTFSRCALRDKFRQIVFLYWGYLESGKTRSGIDISRVERRGKIYTFDDFKFLITLYYTSQTSSKRNTANSFKWTYNFIRGDCQKGVNQLIYFWFIISL